MAVLENFDYCFAENGLTAYQSGKVLESQSFIKHLGEDRYKKLVNFCLREISELDIPIKRYLSIPYFTPFSFHPPLTSNTSFPPKIAALSSSSETA